MSVYGTWRQARHRQMSSPHLGAYIATTMLTPMHGPVSEPSAQGHMDWWPFAGMLDSDHFEVTAHEH
jgi:hypothetical protein